MISLIPDDAHLPEPVFKNILALAGAERCLVVSDAISAAGLGPGLHSLGQRQVRIESDGVPRAADGSHFVGSGLTPGKVMAQLRAWELSTDVIDRLTRKNPARILGLEESSFQNA